MPKIFACFALLLLSASSGYAQWERVVIAWTGKSDPALPVTYGSPHPLQYYLTPSPERDPTNSLNLGEKVGKHEIRFRDYVVETSQRALGDSFGRKIAEIDHSFLLGPELMKVHAEESARETGDPGRVYSYPDSYYTPVAWWKSVVMESAPGAYRELYLLIDVGVFVRHLSEASLLTIEGTRLLSTTDFLQGNGASCWQRYWVLDRDGPSLVDLSALDNEVKKVIPPNASVVSCPSLAAGELEMSYWVKGDCGACNLGTAVVDFRLDGHRAIPVSSRFEAEDSSQPN